MISEKAVNRICAQFLWSGIPFEELKAEATAVKLESEKKYNPEYEVKPITFQWNWIYNELKDYVWKELEWRNRNNPDCSDLTPAKDPSINAFEITQSFSEEAKQVCSAIFNSPAEYMSLMPKMARGKLVRKFRNEGRSWPTIWRVFNEIKSALK